MNQLLFKGRKTIYFTRNNYLNKQKKKAGVTLIKYTKANKQLG
jgi:hypothetical protein